MTARLLSRAIVVALAIAPWIGLLPFSSALVSVVWSSALYVAALHGAGLGISRAFKYSVDAALAIQWGIAAVIAVGGVMLACRVYGHTGQTIVVIVGAAVHTVELLRELRSRADAIAAWRADARWWLVPAIAAAALGAVHILGAAGDVAARPFDDDGHVIAQLQRLGETGALDDAIGFARRWQFGGQLAAIAPPTTLANGVHFARWVDGGLGIALVLALAIARIRPRDGATATWTLVVIVALSALPIAAADLSTLWIATGLIAALFLTIDEHGDKPVPIALVAGALATLRHELVPIAVVALAGAWWSTRAKSPPASQRRYGAVLLATTATVITPYIVARAVAWSGVPASLLSSSSSSRILALILCIGAFAAAAPIALALAGLQHRRLALATAAGVAGIASQLVGERAYALRFLWPILLAFGVVLALEGAHHADAGKRRAYAIGFVGALLACMMLEVVRDLPGPLRWSRRYAELGAGIETLRDARAVPLGTGDRERLASVRDGARVAVAVAHPELLPYDRLDIIDVNTPRLRVSPREAAEALGADYLLVDDKLIDLHR